MVFFELKQPWHQPGFSDCVPTTLKVLFESQFDISYSLRQWKNRTEWTAFGVTPLIIRDMEEWLIKEHKVEIHEELSKTEEDLAELLSEGVLPFIYLPMNYLNGNVELSIDEEGTEWLHPVIPVGIEGETIYIYDCMTQSSGKSLPKNEVAVKMNLPQFLKIWDLKQRRVFWFTKKHDKETQLKIQKEYT